MAYSYKYYLLGDTLPVRVTYNERGLKLGAEIPDAATGALRIQTTLLSKLETSHEVDEIDLSAFDARCRDVYTKKTEFRFE